ncbi:MAG: ABC transporter permease [Eubacteriales bacterium]|nr:ABC transporter permease [Eubacteriales bacterium]
MHRSLFASPYLIWMIIFTVLPLLLIVYYSFTDASGNFTLDSFKTFIDSNYTKNKIYESMGPEYASYISYGSVNTDILLYSLKMAVECTLICLLIAYPLAYFITYNHTKHSNIIIMLFIIPMWMNFLLRTIAWMSILEDNGLLNTFRQWLGLAKRTYLYTNTAVLLGMVYNFLPFMIFPIYTSLSKMDYKLIEASYDLGANRFKTFLKVILPISVPGIISGITMVFMPSVTTFFIPRILGGGNTMMFGDLIENKFLTEGNWNVGSALSLIMMVLILASLGILRKVDPEGEGGSLL